MTNIAAISPSASLADGRGDLVVDFRDFDPDRPIDVSDIGDGIQVWLIAPDVGGERDARVVEGWLSPGELARRARIQHPRALAEFLAGRRLVRSILAPLLGVAPAEISIAENDYGALSLDPRVHTTDWQFNISHTDGLLALAIAKCRVGVDVEWTTRPGRTVELAERYFAKAEVAALRALPEAAQRDRFFDLWTLKEAYIKARGMGLAIPLSDFAYHLQADQISLTVAESTRDVPDASWQFRLARIGIHHRIAVAASRR